MTETKLPGMVINKIDKKSTYNSLVGKGEIGENDLCLVENEDSISPGGSGTDISLGVTGASVGDIIKVKQVDANGKPTEWEAAGFKKIREFTLPDDPSTDTSDITYTMCTVNGYTDKISQCSFSTDDSGEPFSVKETILIAQWGTVISSNYFGMGDQNSGLGYGNIFSNMLDKKTLNTFLYHTYLAAGIRITTRYENPAAMYNIAGIYTIPAATDDMKISTIKIGTFLNQAMLSGSSFILYGR